MKKSQIQQILNHLQKGKTLTPLQALRLFDCLRLGARIWDLRQQGYDVVAKIIKTSSGKYVAKYSL